MSDRISKGPIRAGQNHAYGTVAPRVREALATHGAIEAAALARLLGVSNGAVEASLNAGVKAGRAVYAFRGVAATRETAAALRRAAPLAITSVKSDSEDPGHAEGG